MKIYLMRHADYNQTLLGDLNQNGINQTLKMASFLKQEGIRFDFILSSKKTRAVQTARLIADALGITDVVETELAMPKASPQALLEHLATLHYHSVLVVSHLPFLNRILDLTIPDHVIDFDRAAICSIEKNGTFHKLHWYKNV